MNHVTSLLKTWGLTAIIAGIFVSVFSCSSRNPVVDEPLLTPTSGMKLVKSSAASSDDSSVSRVEELRPIFFDYDRYDLRSDAWNVLHQNAKWLKDNPVAKVQVEGHADERGTREYNLVLGNKRAAAARNALLKLGISDSRISTVSYGAQDGQSPATWAKHRKTAFILIFPSS